MYVKKSGTKASPVLPSISKCITTMARSRGVYDLCRKAKARLSRTIGVIVCLVWMLKDEDCLAWPFLFIPKKKMLFGPTASKIRSKPNGLFVPESL